MSIIAKLAAARALALLVAPAWGQDYPVARDPLDLQFRRRFGRRRSPDTQRHCCHDGRTYPAQSIQRHVIDGTGAPARRADIGVSDGRITWSARLRGRAAHHRRRRPGGRAGLHRPAHALRRADLLGRRDSRLRRWHGVTSVVMGNCGVGIAPCRPAAREIAMRDLVNVEAIPFEVLDAGHHVGLGDLPAVHGRRGAAQARAQPRVPRAAHAVPALRDGRGIDGARGDRRGDCQDQSICWAKRSTPAPSASRARCSTSTWAIGAGRSRAATRAARS